MPALQRHRLEMLPADGTLGAAPMKLQLLVKSLPGAKKGTSGGAEAGGVDVSNSAAFCDAASCPVVEYDVGVASLGFG